ncbi:hypothetical protein M422DRAFT_254501 [Sphaerobolus stellatus SS14]|uniref:Uncharacterized protein n=1 Tax=Sphaerobolus stellatus (strain SS14) TaxID=990650 RepID=A0A0C9VV53_SPHS4|nr:hypothetical protein M422DRAFT_254501 [Sphaerobolus stellatus SS14]
MVFCPKDVRKLSQFLRTCVLVVVALNMDMIRAGEVELRRATGVTVMYDDMVELEQELTGNISKYRLPTPSDFEEDSVIQQYLAELEEPDLKDMEERIVTGMVDLEREDPSDVEREFTFGESK